MPKRLTELAIFFSIFLLGLSASLVGRSHLGELSGGLELAAGIFMTAIAINSFVLLLHEAMHHTLFAHRGVNRAAAVGLGALFLMSFSAYQVLHTRHHLYLGDERDPDDYHNYSRHRRLVWALHFVRLFAGSILYVGLIPLLAWRHADGRAKRHIVQEYLFLALVYAGVGALVPWSTLLVVWGAPLLLVGWMTSIRGLTQHGITDATDPYLASRSILSPAPIAFLLLHENHHLEHHLFPEVPSYHLRRLHDLLWPHLPYVVTGHTYLGFLWRFLRQTLHLDESPIGFMRLRREHEMPRSSE